jgi:peptidyl-prolyl cis-trans isomerase B (cyclophilin B)
MIAKRIYSLLLTLCLLAGGILVPSASAQAEDDIQVFVDNAPVFFDQAPIIDNGRTLVPLRAVIEAFGARVVWYPEDQVVAAQAEDTIILLLIGDTIAYTGNAGDSNVDHLTEITLDTPAKIVEGRTLVPLRFIAEAFSCRVSWKEASRTISITTLNKLEENKVNITIEMQDGGKIKAELYPDIAPITVANFEKLINEHFFDGLIFHRVISGFMIQGGGFNEKLEQKQADSIKGEFASNGVENPLRHTRGVLSMARTMIRDSASSQFFIMHQDAPHLDGEYAAFGKVTEGMDVVDNIASSATNAQDMPVTPQVIKTITIDE